ncbi:MAG: transposase [Phycisphaerales bacterium]|nr:MAG: transposase [Phycisphaerales bacterium]
MTRTARAVAVGIPHHVIQRGNNRQDVFFVDEDRERYLELLQAKSQQYGLEVHAYCLMTNHVHLVVVPLNEEALAKGIGRTHFVYSRYVNRLHGRSGHLWQNRFFSCPLEETHYWRTVAYVERNPVRARAVRRAWRYPWSSAQAHLDVKDPLGLLDLSGWRRRDGGERWKEQLQAPEDDGFVGRLRTRSFNGLPLGSDSFVSKLEVKLNRRLRPAPVGRPRKKAPRPKAKGPQRRHRNQ